jgi:effector-binding domain-containing protein
MIEEGNMDAREIVHKEIESMQVACIKTVVDKRTDVLPLLYTLRQTCGDAICGPAMAIYHFGAVQTGFLVEAAFPVSRPVEADGVYTRQLEGARVTTITHTGPHESVRDAVSQLYEYGRTHAGAAGGQREIYLSLDLDQPEENVTEIQLVRHEWDRLLAQGVESNLGAVACEQVMAGIEQIIPDSPLNTYTEWIRGAMDRLDDLTDDPTMKYQVMSGCAHVFPGERIAHLRAIYEERRAVDDVLREMYKDPAWYEDPIRKGNVIHMTKVPYDPTGYKEGDTPAERRNAYCHCRFVRPYLDRVPSKLSPTFCWCGSGWYRRLWEGVLGLPVRIGHVETLVTGANQCTLTVTLPLELEGEMSRELANPRVRA